MPSPSGLPFCRRRFLAGGCCSELTGAATAASALLALPPAPGAHSMSCGASPGGWKQTPRHRRRTCTRANSCVGWDRFVLAKHSAGTT